MRTGILIIQLFAVFFLFQCARNTSESADESAPLPTFRTETFQRTLEGCDPKKNYCAKIQAEYPVLESGVPVDVRRVINDSVLHYVKSSLTLLEPQTDLRNYSLSALADTLFASYTRYSKEAEYVTAWELETTGAVLFLSANCISISLENFGFTGGAHPYSNTSLVTYDLRNGAVLNVLNLVHDKKSLFQLAEKAFRKSRALAPEDDLNAAGFFGETGFQLPTNIGIVEEGLYFYYNSYEIAAYAWGPTDFMLTWEELGDLVDKTKIE